MKKYFVLLWLLLPLPVLVLHFGRGQQWLAKDQAAELVEQAVEAEKREDWKRADELYREASALVAKDDPQMRLRFELAQIRNRYRMGDAVAAIDMSEQILRDPGMATMPSEFKDEARDLAGRIHYFAAWVMRLEGARRELWMEEAELARQNFRLLAESSGPADPAAAKTPGRQENLESAVQLQRLSLTELMARPLPKEGQCMGGQGLSEQMSKRRGKRGKGQQPGQGPGDGEPAEGAGSERFQPGSGS